MPKFKKPRQESRTRTWKTVYDDRAWAEMKARNGYSLSSRDKFVLGVRDHD